MRIDDENIENMQPAYHSWQRCPAMFLVCLVHVFGTPQGAFDETCCGHLRQPFLPNRNEEEEPKQAKNTGTKGNDKKKKD